MHAYTCRHVDMCISVYVCAHVSKKFNMRDTVETQTSFVIKREETRKITFNSKILTGVS